jgi:hypothetical protein
MADNQKVLRANVTILAAYPEAFADPANPTAAELNDVYDPVANPDGMVFDISCATLDDYTLNLTDSDTDDELSVCDVGNSSSPTFYNYDIELDFFRDKSVTDNGVFNLAWRLFRGVDRPFWLIKRIGKAQGATFLTDGSDVISMYGATTDLPTDVVEDNANAKFGARFKTNGRVNINYSVVA